MLIFVLHSTSDVGQTGQWTWTSSTTPLQSIKWNAHILIMFNFWWLARLVNGLKPHPPPLSSQKKWNAHFWIMFNFWWSAWLIDELEPHLPPLSYQKNEMLIFWIHSTSDDQPGWSMDSNPICHLSPTKKMKCSFLDYVQLLMISWAGRWPQTPSATPLQPIKWNAHFWIKFNVWWSAGLVDGLKPRSPPLSTQKNDMHIFGLCSTSDDWLGWSMDSNPIHCPSPAKKMKCFFFGLHSTSDDWPGWVIDSNPIHHPSPANKMKWSFLDYIQLLMISWAGRWTQTPFTTPLQPKKWNAHFLIMFNFWWSAGLVNGLKPHLPALSSQKYEMLLFGLRSTSDDRLGWSMDSNPILHPSPAKEMKCSFLYYVQLLMIGWAGQWTQTPSTTPLQPKQWNAHFCITLNIWCWPDRSMDLNLIHHPSPAKKNEMLIFWLCSTSDDQLGWSMDLNPIHHPSAANKMKCFFLDYVHFWWSARLIDGLKPHLPPLSSQKNEILIFGLRSTSDDQLGWSMDSNPIHHPSPAKKMKCSFFDYVQLLMISWAGRWT